MTGQMFEKIKNKKCDDDESSTSKLSCHKNTVVFVIGDSSGVFWIFSVREDSITDRYYTQLELKVTRKINVYLKKKTR